MGVGISDILIKKNIQMSDLSNRIIAIDAFNVLYQFLTTIRQYDGSPLRDSKGRVTSHLSGLFYRTSKMLEEGIKPVYVFDGKPPDFKLVSEERHRRKEEAKLKEEEARERGDIAEAAKWARQTVKITPELIEGAKNLLKVMGVPIIQAPSEGEAQASLMVREGKAWAVCSQDLDCLLFGSPRLVRNVAVSNKRKVPGKMNYSEQLPEIIDLKENLTSLNLTQDKLIMLGLLVGTDFNPGGIEGLGPKKALKYVETHDGFSGLEWKWDKSPEELMEFFRNPPVTQDYSLERKAVDIDGLKNILVKEHEFSEERIDSAMRKIKERGSKPSLSRWVK